MEKGCDSCPHFPVDLKKDACHVTSVYFPVSLQPNLFKMSYMNLKMTNSRDGFIAKILRETSWPFHRTEWWM